MCAGHLANSYSQALPGGQVSQNAIAIQVHELSKSFGSFSAVSRVSFAVKAGEIFGFLGPNGSGKTTTIRMMLGLLPPTQGEVNILGIDVKRHPERIRPRIGYMSQRFSLYNDLTVIENLRFYGKAYGLHNTVLTQRIRYAQNLAGLEGREHQLTRELSGGWRQRLALSAAILHQPELIFLDEPTAGVDPVSRRSFWELLYTLANEGITVFVTTHYMDEAERCHRLAFIQRGHLIAQGTPDEIKSSMMKGKVLELIPPDAGKVLNALQEAQAHGRLPASEVGLYGSRVHVITENVASLQKSLIEELQQRGLSPGKITVLEPTLEDVFIACLQNTAEAESGNSAGKKD